MSAIFEVVGFFTLTALALALSVACFDYCFRLLPAVLRLAIALVVRGGGIRRLRNALRQHHGRRGEILRDRDLWYVTALWYQKQLHDNAVMPEMVPEGMTPEQARQAEQAALVERYGEPR